MIRQLRIPILCLSALAVFDARPAAAQSRVYGPATEYRPAAAYRLATQYGPAIQHRPAPAYGPATQHRPAMPASPTSNIPAPAGTDARKSLPTPAATQFRPVSHQDRYPFAFDPHARYPGGFAPHRYPHGQYLGGYRYPFGYDYYNYGRRGTGQFSSGLRADDPVVGLLRGDITPRPVPIEGDVVGPPVATPNAPPPSSPIVPGGACCDYGHNGWGMAFQPRIHGGGFSGGVVGYPAWTTGDFFDAAMPYGHIPNYGPMAHPWPVAHPWPLGWPGGFGPFPAGPHFNPGWAWNPYSFGAWYGQTAWNWPAFWGFPGGWGWGGLNGPWYGGLWTGFPFGGWGWGAWGW
jgi:hypothetical protein